MSSDGSDNTTTPEPAAIGEGETSAVELMLASSYAAQHDEIDLDLLFDIMEQQYETGLDTEAAIVGDQVPNNDLTAVVSGFSIVLLNQDTIMSDLAAPIDTEDGGV